MILGLTGSIAMGKSATADMFRQLGCPVFDADAAVHQLYENGGEGSKKLGYIYPDIIINGAVSRPLLSKKITEDNSVLQTVEKIIHPLVGNMEQEFIAKHKKSGVKLIVLDIPLLFEAGRTKDMDMIVVVFASAEIQRKRALQRPGMTQKKLEFIISKQVSDSEKCARADYVIDTSKSLEDAFEQVKAIVRMLDPTNKKVDA